MIAVADVLIHSRKPGTPLTIYWIMLGAGLLMAAFGLVGYLKIRKLRMKSPENQTLVQETAATLYFLENYHFIENTGVNAATKGTMLARLGDFLTNHCTILYPKPASKVRTQLTREKSVLGAQRTVAACYRTIYARARTGLAFIRTGVSFSSLGLVLMKYFAFSFLAVVRDNAHSGRSLDDSGRRVMVPACKKGAIRDAEMPGSGMRALNEDRT